MDRRDQDPKITIAMDRPDHQDEAAEAEKKAIGPLARLPDDVFADILRRVPPRGLAACRCVSEAWRAFVDGRRLLRADLLPLSVGGIFINFNNYYISELFSCPASTTAGAGSMISGKHDYLPDPESLSWKQVRDHCNGLVLIRGYGADDIWYVLNPATRWVDSFHSPPPAMGKMDTYEDMYLVYDPAVSPDYEVVSVSRHMHRSDFSCDIDNDTLLDDYLGDDSDNHTVERDPAVEQSEWPPSVCILQVFSSRTGEWEERSFAREGRAIGTVADMRDWHQQRNAVYWRGALYIHCQSDFVMRVSLESDKYHVIEPPTGIEVQNFFPQIYLGKSAKGVYCASIKERSKVQVWNLVESGAPMEWVLKHDKDLLKWLLKNKLQYSRPFKNHGQKVLGPWTLEDINYYYDDFKYDYMDEPVKYELEGSSQVSVDEKSPCNSDNEGISEDGYKDDYMEEPVKEELKWSSQVSADEKSACRSDDECICEDNYSGYMDILGFHPFEEIIFLSESITRGLAYHFNSSKVEILGNLYPAGYEQELGNEQLIMSSFPYTPCWLGQTADR